MNNKEKVQKVISVVSIASAVGIIVSSRLNFLKVNDSMIESLRDALDKDIALYTTVAAIIGGVGLLFSVIASIRSSKIFSFLSVFPYALNLQALLAGIPKNFELDDPLIQQLGLEGTGIGYTLVVLFTIIGMISAVLGLFFYKRDKKKKEKNAASETAA